MERFDTIEAYVLGKLSDSEMANFEKEMDQDASLREEVEEMKRLILGVESHNFRALIADKKIPLSGSQNSHQNRTKRISIAPIMSIAAVLVAGIIGVLFLFQPLSSSDGSDFNTIFYTDPGLPTPMSSNQKNYDFYDGMVDFKLGNYRDALEKWNSDTRIGADTLNYYKGYAEMQLSNFSKAKEYFDNVDKSSTLYEKVLWSRALIHIKNKEWNKAKEMINQISDTKDYDIKSAMELISEMENE